MGIWEEGRRSVRGSFRVMGLDAGGLKAFNLTLEGYWRSFYAAVFLLPLYVVYLLNLPLPKGVGIGQFWLIEAINYPLVWTLWPLISFYICRGAGVADKYAAYITVHNWAQVPLLGGQLLVVILAFAVDPSGPGASLLFLAWIAVLTAETLIVRTTLGLPWPQTIMIEGLAFAVALLLGTAKQFVMTGGG